MTYYDFVVKKEHMFQRNIYDPQELELSENIANLENFYIAFKFFIQVSILLTEFYSEDSDIEYIEHECMKRHIKKNLDALELFK